MTKKVNRWGIVSAFLIVLLILWNTNLLFDTLKKEERTKMELWADAQQELIKSVEVNSAFGTLALEILQKNKDSPIIQVDDLGKIIDYRNIQWSVEKDSDSVELYSILTRLKRENDPIAIQYKDIVNQKVYYGDSSLLKKLRYYPFILLFIVFLFGSVLFFFFKTSKISEQNRLWAGMAKETAHQIGTPLSSLLGWIMLLKEEKKETSVPVVEMEKDISRLEVIVERFSKIGSSPKLEQHDIVEKTENTLGYLKVRTSSMIEWEWDLPKDKVIVNLNESLFSWAIENVVKNGIDAMKGKGKLKITMKENGKQVVLEIIDNGSGVSSKNMSRLFSLGFTTKKRGWGLGLSLTKRIIEEYHNGRIHLKKTIPNVETCFEIILNKG